MKFKRKIERKNDGCKEIAQFVKNLKEDGVSDETIREVLIEIKKAVEKGLAFDVVTNYQENRVEFIYYG